MKNTYVVGFNGARGFEVYGEYDNYDKAYRVAYDLDMEIWHDGKRLW